MKTWQKVTFILVLIAFVSLSITISLISISRPTYKFAPETDETGNVSDGWMFYAFNGNVNTKTLYIDFVRDKNGGSPDRTKPVVSVRKYAVNADEYVEELVIGASVERIDETAFFNVKKLQRVTVDPENQWFKSVDGVLYSKDGKRLVLYPICRGQQPTENPEEFTYPEAYAVPEGVERIETFAFLKNGHLRDVTLPSTLREIGDMAFFDCGWMGAVDYDKETDTLVGAGFQLPDGLEKIGSDAFSKCGSIAPGLYIPASVKEIGHHAFFSCGNMKQVLVGAPDADAMTVGEAWLPKNVKAGPAWRSAKAQYGATRADSDKMIADWRAEKLEKGREEAKNDA